MWTIRYKHAWIHGYCDRDEVRIQWPDYSQTTRPSLRAAKLTIRKSA